jgi:hypothetical protein
MAKDEYKGDAEAYARSLENPEEFFTQFRDRHRKSIPRRRPGEKQNVGYGRPPINYRWKPGQSGNPLGLRKRSKNLRSAIEKILTDKITIREGNKVRRVTRIEAVILKQLSQALAGNHKAIQAVYASAKTFGLLEVRPEKLVVGDLGNLTDDELRELERLLTKVDGRLEPI